MVRKKRTPIPMSMEDLEQTVMHPEPLTMDTGIYWWVWGWDGNRRALFGPFASEKEGYDRGYEKLQTDFEVLALRTRNEVEASRQLRYRVLDETENVNEAFRRFRHKIK